MVGDEEIQTTLQHPFLIEGKGWIKAECLRIVDKVRLENRQYKQISNIWMEKKAETIKVYNLSVEDYHTYYVSGHGVLVHNAECSRGKVNILENVGESGKKSSGLSDWLKKRFEAGNNFNKENRPRYPYNEVEVYGKKKYVVDSYVPGKEIVSRKYTQLADVKESTGIGYLNELKTKYPSGAIITDSPFNPKILRGQPMRGQLILEIPVQYKPIPQSVIDYANNNNIIIRNVEGKVCN